MSAQVKMQLVDKQTISPCAHLSAAEYLALFRRVFGSADGKLVLAELKYQNTVRHSAAGKIIDESSFDCDSLIMARREGQKDVVRQIEKILRSELKEVDNG